jgi:hypothetical protein
VHNPVCDAAVKEFVRRKAVGELVPQIDAARILQQHLEVKPHVLGYFRPKDVVAQYLAEPDRLKATVVPIGLHHRATELPEQRDSYCGSNTWIALTGVMRSFTSIPA